MILLRKIIKPSIYIRSASGISFRINELARFSDGSAIAQLNNTSVLVTTVSKAKSSSNQSSFLPLTVDYREKAAAAGRIPTNHLRRELGLTDREILTGRMIDRSIRPLFLNGYVYDTQITCNILSVDGMAEPDVLAINAASASISTSDIPWNGPIGKFCLFTAFNFASIKFLSAAVRIGSIDGKFIMNPTREQLQKSDLNLVVSVNPKGHLVMIDASANRLSDEKFFSALEYSIECCLPIIDQIKSLSTKTKRANVELQKFDNALIERISVVSYDRLLNIFTDFTLDKIARDTAISVVRQDVINEIASKEETLPNNLPDTFSYVVKKIFRNLIFDKSHRMDGRLFDQLRPITCKINLYEPLHGSALFQRGQTQVLCTVAFDALDSQYRNNDFVLRTGHKRKPFILHYEFPPYATNEIGRAYGRADRRELGHGALAEKGVEPIIPNELPFMVRLTSEVLESNGSSSMASVCAASLALMEAGIQIHEPVAGVAIGLVSKCADDGSVTDYRILTDILGIEDYMGDTDFKVAGTRNSITALQADIKNMEGLPLNIVQDALRAARDARCKIIDIMNNTISEPRKTKKYNTPELETLTIPSHKRGRFLGIGGLNLKKILTQTGVTIVPIDEITYSIFAPNKDAMNEAKQIVNKLLEDIKEPELEFGGIYTGKIVEIRANGVLLQLYPTMPPVLLPNSQLDRRKVDHPSALGLNVGDDLQVKYFGRDPVSGTMRLSRKILLNVGGVGPIKNMIATEKDEKRPGIWDVRSSKTPKSSDNKE
ncbi:unnamed protein product [Rotaria socialis]|uniref:polyribonucleotide nucleotidyltransferase n=1 Tax=Rotaria socialis TaxID=392032 RepID=A0A817WB17_9BILA|nr:unnamed protein product [Rotaria socialis]CAF3477376.1 unnamed protein product [Rotaria socialis]